MILFQEDWRKYPTAFADLKTPNQTYVRLASVYREMGVKNHTFMLALVNPMLQGVDPFEKHLPMEIQAAIAVECQINPWYFFREVGRAPPIAGYDPVPVEANRGNIALWWLFFNHVMTILIQIRQTGKSFSTDLLMTYLLDIVCQNTAIEMMTKDDDLRRTNVKRIKDIFESLPSFLCMKTKDDLNNTEQITVNALGNRYNTHVPQASPKRAINMGRGLTTPIFHADEAPFQPNIALALPAALAATGAAMDAARRNDTPYGIILTTTAGRKDDKDGAFIYRMVEESAEWAERFLDARNKEHLYEIIKHASRGGLVQINATFNHRQLGKTDAWLMEKLTTSKQTGEEADRDFFNRWTSGTQSHPLPIEVLNTIAESEMEVVHTQIDESNYVIRWYIDEDEIEHRMATGQFILSQDPSEAAGKDDIGMVLLDAETLEVVAAGTYNETNLIMFAKWVCSILVRWRKITCIIERRSMGAMLLDYLLYMLPQHGIDPFTRLFNWVVQEFDENPERFKEIRQPMSHRIDNIYTRHKGTFGFATSGSGQTSRTALYSTTLHNASKRAGNKVRDKKLIKQIKGLIVKNGRVDHPDGEHDDLIIAWLLAHWFLTMGKNLSFYGIDPTRVMSAVHVPKEETPEQSWRRMEQEQIRTRIFELHDLITNEEDDFITQKYEHELRLLDKRIILEQDEIYSVDELLRSAREAKRKRRVRPNFQVLDHDARYRQVRNDAVYSHGVLSDKPLGWR